MTAPQPTLTRPPLAPHLFFMCSLVGVGLSDGTPLLSVVLLALYAAGLLFARKWPRTLGQSVEALAALVILVISWLYASARGDTASASFKYWLAGMLVLRAWVVLGKRDFGFCFLIAAALFAHVSRVYSDLPFVFYALATFLIAPYALLHFLAVYGGFQPNDTPQNPIPVRMNGAHVRGMTWLAALLLAVACVVFLVVPRPPGSGLNMGRDSRNMTGFSPEVTLGNFDEIVQQQQVAMIVKTNVPESWRGGTLELYDGSTWRAGTTLQRTVPAQLRQPPPRGEKVVVREFYLANSRWTGRTLFTGGYTSTAKTQTSGWTLNRLPASGIVVAERGRGAVQYVAVSFGGETIWDPRPSATILREPAYRQLPERLSPPIRALAQQITAGQTTPDDKIRAITTYLSTRYAYSLTGLGSGAEAPLDHFLFVSRQGHCEYFATAAAILLRCVGVPTRVVQGFAPGTQVDDRYVVRMSDAHLWAEAYVGNRWVTVDATPASANAGRIRTSGYWEQLQLRWYSSVLLYDTSSQTVLFRELMNRAQKLFRAATHLQRPNWLWIGGGLLAVFGLWGARRLRRFSLRWTWNWRRPQNAQLRGNRTLNRLFAAYLKQLRRQGYGRRHPGTTPHDLVAALKADGAPILADAEFLTELYYATRFGGRETTHETLAQARAALNRLQAWRAPRGGKR